MLVDHQVSFCLQPMFMLVLLSVLFSHYVRPFYTIERDAQVSERLAVEDLRQRKRIIANVHDSSHLGVNRTLDMITAKYYWPGLTQDVKEYVSGLVNVVCIRCNTGTIYRCCCAFIKPFISEHIQNCLGPFL